jgi:hypothetical protein
MRCCFLFLIGDDLSPVFGYAGLRWSQTASYGACVPIYPTYPFACSPGLAGWLPGLAGSPGWLAGWYAYAYVIVWDTTAILPLLLPPRPARRFFLIS